MRMIIVAVIVMLTGGVGFSFGQSGDEAAIKKLNEDYASALQKRDVKAALACHTDDAGKSGRGRRRGRKRQDRSFVKGAVFERASGWLGGAQDSRRQHDHGRCRDRSRRLQDR